MKTKTTLRSFHSLMKPENKIKQKIDKSGNNEIKTLILTSKRPKINNGF